MRIADLTAAQRRAFCVFLSGWKTKEEASVEYKPSTVGSPQWNHRHLMRIFDEFATAGVDGDKWLEARERIVVYERGGKGKRKRHTSSRTIKVWRVTFNPLFKEIADLKSEEKRFITLLMEFGDNRKVCAGIIEKEGNIKAGFSKFMAEVYSFPQRMWISKWITGVEPHMLFSCPYCICEPKILKAFTKAVKSYLNGTTRLKSWEIAEKHDVKKMFKGWVSFSTEHMGGLHFGGRFKTEEGAQRAMKLVENWLMVNWNIENPHGMFIHEKLEDYMKEIALSDGSEGPALLTPESKVEFVKNIFHFWTMFDRLRTIGSFAMLMTSTIFFNSHIGELTELMTKTHPEIDKIPLAAPSISKALYDRRIERYMMERKSLI